MNQAEHFFVIRPGIIFDAVQFERFWCRSPRLIQSGDKAGFLGGLLRHLLVYHLKVPLKIEKGPESLLLPARW